MKRKLIILTMLSSIFLVGCDFNDSTNVEISSDNGWYINTSESVDVTSYNGFRLIKSKKIVNEDDSVRIILDFDRVIK